MIWTFCSSFIVVLYPLWESRAALAQITRGVVKVRCFQSVSFMTAPLKPPLFVSFVLHAHMICRTYFLLEAENLQGP